MMSMLDDCLFKWSFIILRGFGFVLFISVYCCIPNNWINIAITEVVGFKKKGLFDINSLKEYFNVSYMYTF